MTNPIPNESESSRQSPASGAYLALTLLLAINLLNYIDRYILAGVLPKVQTDPALMAANNNEPLSYTQVGALAPAFVWAYALFSPLFGWLGDRWKRWFIVGLGVILWSFASGGTGLATGFLMLFLTRCMVGIGEAAYGPVAPTVLSDMFPVSRRGTIMALFYMAIPVGSAIGFLYGGVIADSSLGWRWAFYLVVPPGILLGVLCFFMKEPPIGLADAVATRKATRADYLLLPKIPSFVCNTIAATGMSFAIGGMSYWMPTYIYDREAGFEWTDRVIADAKADEVIPVPQSVLDKVSALKQPEQFEDGRAFRQWFEPALDPKERQLYTYTLTSVGRTKDSLSLGAVGLYFGVITALGGLTATLFGGWLGDRLRTRYGGSYFLVSGWSAIIGLPMFVLALIAPFPMAWLLLFLAVFAVFVNTGPSNTALANVVPPAIRSSAFAFNILIIHVLGDGISPTIIGMVGDASNLTNGLMLVSVMIGVSGVVWVFGARYLARDTELAPTRLQ